MGGACALALLLVLLTTIGATAQAQDTDPFATSERAANENDLDTDVTPVAKDSKFWALQHGAKFRETEAIEGSATSFDSDLFSVSFRNRTIGLAGGSACSEAPSPQAGESDADFGKRVSDCRADDGVESPRVPVLYRYTAPRSADPRWEKLSFPGSGSPGYVGAITWIDADRALIVGGTGTYPRREEPADGKSPIDPTKADPAGKARAWLYRRSADSVTELGLSALTQDQPDRAGMRGLSAIDCHEDERRTFEEDPELCFAGGLAQIWEWRDGAFTGHHVDTSSPDNELTDAKSFRYRVREIEFVGEDPPVAAAVTSGCCAETEAGNIPRFLVYDGTDDPAPASGRWFVDHFNNPLTTARRWGPAAPAKEYEVGNPELPDSLYGLTVHRMFSRQRFFYASAIATPGGRESSPERPSIITQTSRQGGTAGGTYQTGLAIRTPLSTARLVAGDGDVARSEAGGSRTSTFQDSFTQPGPAAGDSKGDGQPDWAVGELRSTKLDGLGTRGLMVATALPPSADDSLNVGSGGSVVSPTIRPTPDEIVSGWEPIDQGKLDAHIRSRHFLLPSYSANAIDIVGAQEDGWIVGDHGAILRLAENEVQSRTGASEPKPPRLGSHTREPLSDRRAYGEGGPALSDRPGVVPRLGGSEIRLDEPRMVASGQVGSTIRQIVMSRDSTEGWAIGAKDNAATFTHFDGERWRSCDPIGIESLKPPDPACEQMAPLRGYYDASNEFRRVALTAAARVPLERDTDPTNDDDLEIVAVGESYQGPETGGKRLRAVVRYRDGAWTFEDAASIEAFAGFFDAIDDLVFTAPDDGWMRSDDRLFHFDGEQWIDCKADPARCGDPDGILPTRPAAGPMQTAIADGFEGLIAAGDRVYLYGSRVTGTGTCTGFMVVEACLSHPAPLILYRDRGGEWTDGSGPGGDRGGLDPALHDPATPESGRVRSMSIVETEDGLFQGWAVGEFGGIPNRVNRDMVSHYVRPPRAALLRLDPAVSQGWREFRSPGAFEDYMHVSLTSGKATAQTNSRLHVGSPSPEDPDATFVGQLDTSRIFGFNDARGRFEMLESGRPQGNSNLQLWAPRPAGALTAMAPDGSGGFWAAISGYMFHYTDRAPKPIFEEVANPLGTRGVTLRAIDGGPDGSVWVSTDSNRLFRHDPTLGWEEVQVPGWDPGRVVTRASRANAIAVGPGGEGVVVGEGGRIANVSSGEVVLDAAAGTSCALGDPQPCGTSRDLTAVDVAPDGSVIAAGDRLSFLWRGPEGEFRSIAIPPTPSSTEITAVSYPHPARAYVAADTGAVFRGDMSVAGEWSWSVENDDSRGDLISRDQSGKPVALRDIAVDASGHGYAVGDGGLILERTEEGGWRRVVSSYPDDLTAVDLPEVGGEGALIGGEAGLILTLDGAQVEIARHSDFSSAAPVTGFAYLPGPTEGSVDVWAGIPAAGRDDARLLRYRSDSEASALAASVTPIADSPPHSEDDLSLAAFGKSDCDLDEGRVCPEASATTTTQELIPERIVDELDELREKGALDLAVMSGDATDSAGFPGSSIGDYDRSVGPGPNHLERAGQLKHRRYAEFVIDELEEEDVPMLGAVGGQDLSETFVCDNIYTARCETPKRIANAGENFGWREAFGGRMEPWGDGDGVLESQAEDELELVTVDGAGGGSVRTDDQRADPDGDGVTPEAKAEIGGANTHYAVDALRGGEPLARLVFVDTSMRSLQGSDAIQQPQELSGGQTRFLERMICIEGNTSSAGDRCTREKGQRAIVVSNTPTYSYGPGALTHTASDANVFEALMLKHDVDLVISGALGYNGLYYTLAPGLHEPCPGGEYPHSAPTGATPDCLAGPAGALGAQTPAAASGVADPTSLITEQGLSGSYPTLIAAGAGGKFGPDGREAADGPAGQWHGYSIARLQGNGDLVVEQRPILDWIGMDAARHVLRPRQKLRLRGYGRSPVSTGISSAIPRADHYEISSPAITHRYDLLRADPDTPWIPLQDKSAGPEADGPENCGAYTCLEAKVATVDAQSGDITAGSGNHPPTFAVAMLSVGERAATYPLHFEPSPAFRFSAPTAPTPVPVLAPIAPPGAPTTPPTPQVPSVSFPQPAPPPMLVPPPPPPPAAPPQPPIPPPVPPANVGPSPLSLSFAPTGLVVAPTASVIPPPAPPINPAPPGGARKEARQRQAATQKSGADGDGAEDKQFDNADQPNNAPGANMTRHEHSFSAYSPPSEATAWTTGALYGGGISLLALALALGWTRGRPTPRRHEPRAPAPALAHNRSRRR